VITVVEMDMWSPFATGRRKLRKHRLIVLHRVSGGSSSIGSERSSAGLETQEFLRLLRHLAASTSLGAIGSVTQSSTLTSYTTAS
jgi:hypothetical protein